MKRALLMLMLAGAAPLAVTARAEGPATPKSAAEAALRLPLRSHGEGASAPQVSEAPGVILIEVPAARLEHSGVMAPPVGSRLSVAIGEIAQGNVHAAHRSGQRATVTLRLRPGAALRAAEVQAVVEDGVLRIGLAPLPRPPAATGTAAVLTPSPRSAPAPSAAAPATAPDPGNGLWLRVLIALTLLGAAALLALRLRLRPRRGAEVRPAAIDIIASRALGRNQRLLVVDVDRQRFLLSASEQGGLRLVAPMKDEGPAVGQSASRAAPPADAALGDVFADMLASVTPASSSASAAPAPAPAAPAAAAPAPAPGGRRANLHLVDGTRSARPSWSPNAPGTFTDTEEPAEAAAASGTGRPLAQQGSLGSDSDVPGSSDVAGLVALRRHRHGGRR